MSNSDITKKAEAGDAVHTASKAAISLIPFIGGAAAEIFSKIVVAPVSKIESDNQKNQRGK